MPQRCSSYRKKKKNGKAFDYIARFQLFNTWIKLSRAKSEKEKFSVTSQLTVESRIYLAENA